MDTVLCCHGKTIGTDLIEMDGWSWMRTYREEGRGRSHMSCRATINIVFHVLSIPTTLPQTVTIAGRESMVEPGDVRPNRKLYWVSVVNSVYALVKVKVSKH
jgi:hypothetical protein